LKGLHTVNPEPSYFQVTSLWQLSLVSLQTLRSLLCWEKMELERQHSLGC